MIKERSLVSHSSNYHLKLFKPRCKNVPHYTELWTHLKTYNQCCQMHGGKKKFIVVVKVLKNHNIPGVFPAFQKKHSIVKIIAPACTFLGVNSCAPFSVSLKEALKRIYGRDLEAWGSEKCAPASKLFTKGFSAAQSSRLICVVTSHVGASMWCLRWSPPRGAAEWDCGI